MPAPLLWIADSPTNAREGDSVALVTVVSGEPEICGERSTGRGNKRDVRTLARFRRTVCPPVLSIATAVLAIAGCDDSEALPDLETVSSRASNEQAPPAGLAASFMQHLDGATPPKNGERRRVLVRQPYGSLQHLSGAVYVSDRLGTASSTVLHLDPKENLRRTQFTVGAEGGLVIDSSLAEDGDMVRSLVVYGADGTLRRIPTGVEEVDEVGPCIDAALEAKEPVESILDCLGFGGGSGGSDPGFAEWFDDLRNPDCGSASDLVSGKDTSGLPLETLVAAIRDKYGSHPGVAAVLEDVDDAMDNYDAVRAEPTVNAYSALARVREAREAVLQSVGALLVKLKRAGLQPPFGSPLPSPDGLPGTAKDPRCEQRKTDSARGTLFASSDFCTSGDVMQCLAEEQDPIRRITDGKCRTTEGHDGRAMLTCGDNPEWSVDDAKERAQGESSSTCGASPDGTQSYCDFNVPFESSGNIGEELIDTMDVGPVFEALCAVGDCGIPQF